MYQQEIKIRVIPAIGFITAIYCFFIWLSQDFYPENAFGYALFGSVLLALCFYYTITGMQTAAEFNESIPQKIKFGMTTSVLAGIASFILLIITTIYLTILYSNIKEKELKTFGKVTTGEIVSGYSLTGGNAPGVYDVTVEYRLDDGELIKAYTRVSPQEFSNYYVGKNVNVIYSSKNHTLIDLLTNDEEVKTYVKVDNKNIKIKHLIALLTIKESEIGEYLNNISYSWQRNAAEKSWINRQKDIYIKLDSENSISYITSTFSVNDINKEKDSLKFKAISFSQLKNSPEIEKFKFKLTSADGAYENEKFGLIIKTLVLNEQRKMATIINVFKK